MFFQIGKVDFIYIANNTKSFYDQILITTMGLNMFHSLLTLLKLSNKYLRKATEKRNRLTLPTHIWRREWL